MLFLYVVLELIMVLVMLIYVLIFTSLVFSSISGAPYVPIARRLIPKVLAFGGLAAGDVIYDLGCGDGRVLIESAESFGISKAIGYERSPWPYWKAKFLIRQAGLEGKINVRRGDFFKADVSGADFIYLYLFPKLVDRLAYKIGQEVKLGTKILSLSFPIDLERHPEFKLLKVEKIDKITAYLYEKV